MSMPAAKKRWPQTRLTTVRLWPGSVNTQRLCHTHIHPATYPTGHALQGLEVRVRGTG